MAKRKNFNLIESTFRDGVIGYIWMYRLDRSRIDAATTSIVMDVSVEKILRYFHWFNATVWVIYLSSRCGVLIIFPATNYTLFIQNARLLRAISCKRYRKFTLKNELTHIHRDIGDFLFQLSGNRIFSLC